MKIEKISDTQIRCTLNYSDLNSRSISLKELAYGSTAAQDLFHEMIRRAGEEVGFHVENMPLMVEAIPLSNDGIILNITKIQDPEELDTRFARFAPSIENAPREEDPDHDPGSVLDLMESLRDILGTGQPAAAPETPAEKVSSEAPVLPAKSDHSLAAVYRFRELDPIIRIARMLGSQYRGSNVLYKNEFDHCYYLALHRGPHSPEDYNKICNILTEYGEKVRTTPASESYFREHMTIMVGNQALQCLAR